MAQQPAPRGPRTIFDIDQKPRSTQCAFGFASSSVLS
jgi:hypothetical protein